MKTLLKKAIFGIAATSTLLSLGSCQKAEQEQTVSFYLTYTLSSDNGESMTKSATSAEVFDEFYQKIKSGELVAPSYELTFTEKTSGAVYTVNGTWAGKDMVTLRTGTYKVEGKSTAAGENVQDKCSLTFKDEIVVDVNSKTITLKAAYDCSLIIFSDASIATLSNFNGVSSADLFKFSSYIYAFIRTTLYAEGHKGDAYLAGTHTNGTQFKIYTGNLNYEIGKFYVYNDINTSFNIEKMEEGGNEGTPIDLSTKGTANCYVISAPGAYKFKATVKGNSTESVGTPATAEVLWESFGTDVKPNVGDIIATATYNDGYITFTTPTSLANGNAVVAVKDASGTILWSWHLWVCKGWDPVDTEQVYFNNAGTMMDRNLGATSATPGDVHALGLTYQWGRKDPFMHSSSISVLKKVETSIDFPNTVSSSKSIEWTIQNPMCAIASCFDWYNNSTISQYDRWKESKTIFDPCPLGWHMPNGAENSIWYKAVNEDNNKLIVSLDANFGYDFSGILGNSTSIWYPGNHGGIVYLPYGEQVTGFNYQTCQGNTGGSSWWCKDYDASKGVIYYGGTDKCEARPVRCQKQ